MKNVVLISIDCLRADHMSCYGYRRETTPFIDSLAKRGLFFENAFANGPNTRHSVPSFLTSTYPLLFLDEVRAGRFHAGRKSIAERLKEKGYSTAAIHSNPYISKFYGYDRGFDYFNDFMIGQVEDEIPRGKASKVFREIIKGVKAVFMYKLPHEDGRRINEEALKWLEGVREPFFLWLHYMDVHMPYVPPNWSLRELNLKRYSHIKKIWMGKKIDDIRMREKIRDREITDYINLYDGCIRYVDWILRELIQKVEKNFSDTIFIITADHGEEFREHGDLSHLEKLYDELIHVPLIFYGKGLDSKKIEKVVSLIGLVPTIFYLLGLKEDRLMQGKNFFEEKGYAIAEAWKDERITAYRDEQWKLIVSDQKIELYNLKDDPKEQKNLYTKMYHREKVKEIKRIIDMHIKLIEKEREKRNTLLLQERTKRFINRLKARGG